MAHPRPLDASQRLVVRGAEIDGRGPFDVGIVGSVIASIGPRLAPTAGDEVLEARGGALLPGVRDHHLHLRALAAARASVACGPPDVRTPGELWAALRGAAAGAGWVRGVGYHESVAGPLGRIELDDAVSDRPVRIQHRSGQLWMLNSRAAELAGLDASHDGRLLHADRWVRDRLGPEPGLVAGLAEIGALLARFGVTGVADATADNTAEDERTLPDALEQEVLVMGGAGASGGPRKIMLHDDQLPGLDELTGIVSSAHRHGRAVAVHVVSRASLWLTLTALADAGPLDGDRIEHGSVIPPDAVGTIARLGITVVTQPNFVAERGDAYLHDVDTEDLPWLYRVAGLRRAGVAVAGGTDAPYGDADPWRAMAAAVERCTATGAVLGPAERVSPEEALALFTGTLRRPETPAQVRPGAPGDLCLLEVPWRAARGQLSSDLVAATIRGGRILHRAGEPIAPR